MLPFFRYRILTTVVFLQFYNGITPQAAGSAFMEDGLVYKVTHVSAGRKLNTFNSYKDVILTEFNVPAGLVSGIFGFSSLSTPKGCALDKTVKAFVQHGGFPLFKTGEGDWADGVFANRSDFAFFEFPANDTTWKITLPAPREGPWFSAVYIKEASDHIRQSGLFAKCDIMYFASFLASKYLDPIIQLNSGETYQFNGKDGERLSRQMFRVALMDDHVDAVEVLVKCNDRCPWTIRARSGALPTARSNGTTFETWCAGESCRLLYFPLQKQTQYIELTLPRTEQLSFNVTVTAIPCIQPHLLEQVANYVPYPGLSTLTNSSYTTRKLMNVTTGHAGMIPANKSVLPMNPEPTEEPLQQPYCPFVIDMARLEFMPAFTSSFGLNHFTWPSTEYLFIPSTAFSDTILRFQLERYKDTGGTLHVALNLTENLLEDLENISISACLNLGAGSRFSIETTCQGPVLLLNSTQLYSEVLIPYPEAGTWHLNVQGRPSTETDSVLSQYIPLKFTIKIDQCVKGSCGPHGTCRVALNSGVLITSACVCQGGWKGWDCSDASAAESSTDMWISIFFLTISNLFFIPATIVAARRRYFTEAIVYAATCFFSSFYHACDQPAKHLTLCILEFNVLQFCDFYVSILSFWMTIIAMADLPSQLKSVAHMVGCIGIALGVEYEKTGLWVFAVPALSAVFVLAASWGFRSYRMKRLNPQKTYWLIHFLPGFVFAALGLILFAFVETKANYKFVHSIWHIAMAVAVICFLPPAHHRSHGKYPNLRLVSAESDLSTSTTAAGSLNQEPAKHLEIQKIVVA